MGDFLRENPDSGRSGIMQVSHKSGSWPTGVIFCAFFTFAAMACAGTYSGGSGTAEDPYKISTVADWKELIASWDDWDNHFVVIADIDFIGNTLSPVAPDILSEYGYQGIAFSGTLRGNGKTFRNIVISQIMKDYAGLFGLVEKEGIIRDLQVVGLNVIGQRFVGGLTPCNKGLIENCVVNGSVSGTFDVGAIAGQNPAGQVRYCQSAGTISGAVHAGGVVGLNDGGVVEDCQSSSSVTCGEGWSAGGIVGFNSGSVSRCHASGIITGGGDIGGVIGSCDNGFVDTSYATGNAIAYGNEVGGFIGYSRYGTISDCYALGNATSILHGDANVSIAGGFAGRCQSSTIKRCFARGNVKGMQEIGGFAGSIVYGEMADCYATGSIEGTDGVGGLVGVVIEATVSQSWSSGKVIGISVGGLIDWKTSAAIIRNCFWDTQTSGLSQSGGGTGKSTSQMKTKSTFTSAKWDFVGEAANGTGDVWRMCGDGVSYPRLSWEFSGGGDMDCPDGVGMEDLVYLAGRWMSITPETAGAADGNGDGKADMVDLGIVSENWMR